MVSVLPTSVLRPLEDPSAPASTPHFNEYGTLLDAVEPFKQQIMQDDVVSVRLRCTIPTVMSDDTCLDLHDLHELRTRLLSFIHELLKSLRAEGVFATYCLAPVSSSLCVVCAVTGDSTNNTIEQSTYRALKNANLKQHKKRVIMGEVDSCPSLIIS